jgi:DNA-binding phage protein
MPEKNNQNEQWMLLVLLLKEIAEEKKLTHQEIADKAELHRSNVTRMFSLNYCPSLENFLKIAKAIKVNFFIEDQESQTDLNLMMEKAMEALGRRLDKLPKN